jgi:hypothetical protein
VVFTHEVGDVTQQPYEEEAHGQAIGTLGFVVCDQLGKLQVHNSQTSAYLVRAAKCCGRAILGAGLYAPVNISKRSSLYCQTPPTAPDPRKAAVIPSSTEMYKGKAMS